VTNQYPYAEGDLLNEPNDYAYSKYLGQAFIDAWSRSRLAVTDDLPPATPPPCGKTQVDFEALDVFVTEEVLEGVICQLEDSSFSGPLPTLEGLLKRFEITKRIHGSFDPDWRPCDRNDYHDLSIYLRFAESLELSYSRFGKLTHLNSLMKCLDTLIAMRGDLNIEHCGRLAWLLASERNHVTTLEEEVRM